MFVVLVVVLVVVVCVVPMSLSIVCLGGALNVRIFGPFICDDGIFDELLVSGTRTERARDCFGVATIAGATMMDSSSFASFGLLSLLSFSESELSLELDGLEW